MVYYVCAVNQTYIESFRHLPFLQTLVAIMGKLFFLCAIMPFWLQPNYMAFFLSSQEQPHWGWREVEERSLKECHLRIVGKDEIMLLGIPHV